MRFFRQILPVALAFVLLAKLTHCLAVDEQLCGLAAKQPVANRPLGNPTEADPNESGCPCKGALVAPPIDCQQFVQRAFAEPAVSIATHYLPVFAAVEEPRSPAQLVGQAPPPLSGRSLRAHFSSLII